GACAIAAVNIRFTHSKTGPCEGPFCFRCRFAPRWINKLLPEAVEADPELHLVADHGRCTVFHAEIRALEAAHGIAATHEALALGSHRVRSAFPALDF